MTVVIDVKTLAKTNVGRPTLDKIEAIIQEEMEKGNTDIVVDVYGLSINEGYTISIADMIEKYNCTFKGLGSKEETVEVLINTYAFVKEKKGVEGYIKWFKQMVENADYPLMIYDNRVKGNKMVDMVLVQPLIFDNTFFHYNVVRQQYMEPVYMEEAVRTKQNIFTRESIRLVDLVKIEEGFRFASNEEERYILDIFEDILSENYWGF